MTSKLKAAVAASLFVATTASAAPGVTTKDPAKMAAGEYALDPMHSSLVASISHIGFSNYTLRFDGLSGTMVYDPARPTAATLKVTIEASKSHAASSFARGTPARRAMFQCRVCS